MDTIKGIIFLILSVFCTVWIIGRIIKALVKFLIGIAETIFCIIAVLIGGWDLLQWAAMVVIMINIVRFIKRKAKNVALKKEAYLQKQDLYEQLH